MQLYNEDSYKYFKTLQEQGVKVDHIITDPPYNISQDNNFTTMGRAGLDFGEWDRGEFDLLSWITMYSQLLNKNGSMIIFCSARDISDICRTLESADMVVKDVLIWQKTNPMPRNATRRYVQDTEFYIWAVKKKAKWIFNKPDDVPYLRTVYQTSLTSGSERLGHPTQKKLELMEYIVSIHTNEGQTILDPFMGVGSTGQACLNLGRDFIGIEREQQYYDKAKERLLHE